jgi:hypothetical protein
MVVNHEMIGLNEQIAAAKKFCWIHRSKYSRTISGAR